MDPRPHGRRDRRVADRRRNAEARQHPLVRDEHAPTWQEQQVQFFTRYLFWCLGLAFFNLVEGIEPAWMSLAQLNIAYALYFVVHTAIVIHAWRHHDCPARYRFAMWVDILILSISVLNDPYALPPSMLVYIMVVLGNGMRYGMRMFGEALVVSFGALMVVFSLRYMGSVQELSAGLIFLNLFGASILIYSYVLMHRIEVSRRQLQEHSRLDALTGLINRRALQECADYLFGFMRRQGGSLVVMLADLDRFKAINDTHGHARGDEVLRDFGRLLRDSVRSSDIAARLGGDEFVLILPDTQLAEAERVARRIQARVNAYAVRTGLDFGTTIAMGEAPLQADSFVELLHRVDGVLYQCKGREDCPGIRKVEEPPAQAALQLETD